MYVLIKHSHSSFDETIQHATYMSSEVTLKKLHKLFSEVEIKETAGQKMKEDLKSFIALTAEEFRYVH